MSKFTNVFIPLFLIPAGVISCVNYGLVKKKVTPNQRFASAVNQNGLHQKVPPQPEKENMINQTLPADVPAKKKIASTTNTESNQSFNNAREKGHIEKLSGTAHAQHNLNQVGLAHLALGIAYAERNMIDQAICEFQSAIQENPHHLESHIQLGTAYGIKGLTNEAKLEFKKAMDIDLNEAVAKIVFNALPIAENTKKQQDLFKAYINLGNAYKKEAKLRKAQVVFEKALALKPGHPIAKKSLSEIYFGLGSSLIENQEYENAIAEFNKVLKINPDFPHIKDVLEKAHYNLGIIYAKNRNLDKAIREFNKTMEVTHNYAMLDKSNPPLINNKGKTEGPDNYAPDSKSHSGGKVLGRPDSSVKKEPVRREKQDEESFQNQTPHQSDAVKKMIVAGNDRTKKTAYDQNQIDGQQKKQIPYGTAETQTVRTEQTAPAFKNNRYARKEDFSFQKREDQEFNATQTEQNNLSIVKGEQKAKNQKPAILDQKMAIYRKSIEHFSLSKENVAVKQNQPVEQGNIVSYTDKLPAGKEINNKTASDYRVYLYNITRSDKNDIGINEAIRKYEDATIKNPYDNNAFLNLAHAYYCKAMYLDDAIALKEDAPEGNQNFSVKRFYLIDDDGEKGNETDLTEQTTPFVNNLAFRNRSGTLYEEMFQEAIVEYKNALQINPNSSNALYGLAFSFSIKGSSPGIALKSRNNLTRAFFSY